MLAWLRLVRVPNLATAAADPLAGFLIVAGLRELAWPPVACGLAVAAVVAIYAGGMVLNDWCDLELDRRERPERPLPSGAIGSRAAATAGGALLAVGLVLAAGATAGHAEPLVMGSCRSLAWLVGMTAAGGPGDARDWLIPIGMGLYAAGITLYARDEAATSRRGTLALGGLVMLAGLATAAGYVWLFDRGPIELSTGAAMPASTWLTLWAIIATSILYRVAVGIGDPAPGRVGFAVGNAIMSMITLDAVLVLAACGERWAIVVLCLLAWFLFFKRLVPPT